MNAYESQYLRWLEIQGVGSRDRVKDSRASYISYLRTVSRLLGEDISPALISSEADVGRVIARISGAKADKTIRNCRSALRKYADMVGARAHLGNGA